MAIKTFCFGFLLAQLVFIPSFSSQLENLASIKRLSRECFSSKNIIACKKALDQIAYYKFHRASKDNFSCHTRLMGLEANLLITLIDLNPKRYRTDKINDLERICESSF